MALGILNKRRNSRNHLMLAELIHSSRRVSLAEPSTPSQSVYGQFRAQWAGIQPILQMPICDESPVL